MESYRLATCIQTPLFSTINLHIQSRLEAYTASALRKQVDLNRAQVTTLASWYLTGCANVTARVRRPGEAVDACAVVAESGDGCARHAHVQYDHLNTRTHKCQRSSLT